MNFSYIVDGVYIHTKFRNVHAKMMTLSFLLAFFLLIFVQNASNSCTNMFKVNEMCYIYCNRQAAEKRERPEM